MKKKISVSILLIMFIILSILVYLDKLQVIDTFIFNMVFKMRCDVMTNIFKTITFFGSTLFMVMACLILVVYFLIRKQKDKSILVGSTLVVSTIINNVIKVIIKRGRPEVVALAVEKSFSYPSGHMMASVTFYGILFYLVLKSDLKKGIKIPLEILLFILPILIGLSRIYLGVHYPSDVVGALLMSTSIVLVTTIIIDKKGNI